MPAGASLDQATQAIVQQMEQSNPGLQASGSSSSIQVNGMQGRSQTLVGNPQPSVRKVNDQRYDVKYQPGPSGQGLLEQLLVTGPNHFQRVPDAAPARESGPLHRS